MKMHLLKKLTTPENLSKLGKTVGVVTGNPLVVVGAHLLGEISDDEIDTKDFMKGITKEQALDIMEACVQRLKEVD